MDNRQKPGQGADLNAFFGVQVGPSASVNLPAFPKSQNFSEKEVRDLKTAYANNNSDAGKAIFKILTALLELKLQANPEAQPKHTSKIETTKLFQLQEAWTKLANSHAFNEKNKDYKQQALDYTKNAVEFSIKELKTTHAKHAIVVAYKRGGGEQNFFSVSNAPQMKMK